MKKRIYFSVLVLIITIIAYAGINWAPKAPAEDPGNTASAPVSIYPAGPNLSFFVIGDVHTDTDALEKLLKDIGSSILPLDALVLNGDIADEGLDKEYDDLKKCLSKNKKYLPATVVKNLGNHEFFDYAKGPNTSSEVQQFISKYLEFSGEKKVYHDRWIEGYHFISLGSEETYSANVDSLNPTISKEQRSWLSEKLSEDYKPGRPILVFLHQPVRGTAQLDETAKILSKYPEVILFMSHTHTYLESNNLVYLAKPFHVVHTGAVHNPIRWGGKEGKTYIKGSQGLYVEIDGSKVVLKGRDFQNGKWISDAAYTFDLKNNQ